MHDHLQPHAALAGAPAGTFASARVSAGRASLPFARARRFTPLDLGPALVAWYAADRGVTAMVPAARMVAASTEHLRHSDTDLFNIGGGNWSAVVWYRPDTIGSAQTLLGKSRLNSTDRGHWLALSADARFTFSVSPDGTDTNDMTVTADSFGDVTAGEWHFVHAWHEDGVGIGISVNGGPADTLAHTGGVADNAELMRVGAVRGSSGTLTKCGDGRMGPIGMAGQLLTAQMVAELYNNGVPRHWRRISAATRAAFRFNSAGTPGDLWWDLDENSGTRDSASGNIPLTNVNSVTSAPGITPAIGQDGIVAAWADQSGNADDLVQADVEQQPRQDVVATSLQTVAILPDGSDDFLRGALGSLIPQPLCIGVAYRCGTFASGTVLLAGDDATHAVRIHESSGNMVLDAGGTPQVLSTKAEMQGAHVALMVLDGANSRLWLDGGTNVLSASPGTNGLDGLTLGADEAGANHESAAYRDVVVLAGTPDDATLDLLGQYLSQRVNDTWSSIS